MLKYLLSFFLLFGWFTHGQNDTIVLNNDDRMVGDFKWLENGLLKFKTDYSWGYFTIDYDDVEEMSITPKCKILLNQGEERIGYIRAIGPNQVVITSNDTLVEQVALQDIVTIETIQDSFWRKFRGLVEVGFNITKASNTKQLNFGADISYIGERWIFQLDGNAINSRQDGAETVRRTFAELSALRLLKKNWFITGDIVYLSNTEQALKYRISPTIAAGNLIVYSPKMYLGLSAGINANFETFDNDNPSRESAEVLLGADINMFNFEDIRLSAGLRAYPSITEKDRFRADFDINVRLSLIDDFYLTVGLTVNYDNQSAIEENQYDYIMKTGLGYKINY